MSELQSATLKPHYHDHRKRLKKRFRQNGLDAFQDYESLELILTYAIAQKDVKPLAKDLLERFKTFQAVLDAPVDELTRIAGIGEHAALLIKIIRQSCDYYLNETILQKDIISSPAELLRYCRASMAALPNEQFRVIHLNA
ncbi:MAG: hypothetical protein GY868_21105, partial [Deltaproteobacteria bacterium]|nr:hypothetical protein [Deltaproteobacteria bacterium]